MIWSSVRWAVWLTVASLSGQALADVAAQSPDRREGEAKADRTQADGAQAEGAQAAGIGADGAPQIQSSAEDDVTKTKPDKPQSRGEGRPRNRSQRRVKADPEVVREYFDLIRNNVIFLLQAEDTEKERTEAARLADILERKNCAYSVQTDYEQQFQLTGLHT